MKCLSLLGVAEGGGGVPDNTFLLFTAFRYIGGDFVRSSV